MMNRKKLGLCLAALLAVGTVFGGCGKDNDGDKQVGGADNRPVVKVGFMGPLTGGNASEGSAARNGFTMAFDQLNESGELPYYVEVVAMDDGSKPEIATSAVQRLVTTDGMVAISGHWNSPAAEATIPICKANNIPLVIWGAIGESLTSAENYPVVTRVCPTDRQENVTLAKYVLEDLGYKNIYIISDTTSYGQSNTQAFQEEMKKYDANLIGIDEVPDTQNDFRAILSKVKQAKPDAIFFGGVSMSGGLVKSQMADAGMDDILLFGISGICSEDFIIAAGAENAEGTFSIKPGTDPAKTEVGQKFLADYEAKNYSVPVGAFTPYSYDAAQVIIQAMKDCEGEITAEKMIEKIAAVKANGLLGETQFDEIGQTTNPASYALVVQDGKWVPWEESLYATGERTLPGRK